jgi:hypothetical protein
MRAWSILCLFLCNCGRLCFEPEVVLGGGSDATSTTQITMVQVDSTRSGSVASLSQAYILAQQAGDLNVVAVDCISPLISVTDTAGNSYQLAIGPLTIGDSDRSLYVYYAANIVASSGGTNTVTATATTATGGTFGVRALEYSGIATSSPLDGMKGSAGSGINADPGSVATTHAHDLLFVGSIFDQNVAVGTPQFATRDLIGGDDIEDRVVGATGSYDAPLTGNVAGGWVVELAAFKAAD